jgi:hypothetical protein
MKAKDVVIEAIRHIVSRNAAAQVNRAKSKRVVNEPSGNTDITLFLWLYLVRYLRNAAISKQSNRGL